MNQLDHLVLAAPDLALASASFEEMTGCRPQEGGSHQGRGTKNALVSFGATSYLEIIAPDPEQDIQGTFGATLAGLDGLQPLHWAIRTNDLEAVARDAAGYGFAPGPIRDTTRVQLDGTRLDWRLMGLGGHELGGLVPFYIDWLDCAHPADTSPVVGPLNSCLITTRHEPLGHLIATTSSVESIAGPNGISFSFQSAKGEIAFHSNAPRGFKL